MTRTLPFYTSITLLLSKSLFRTEKNQFKLKTILGTLSHSQDPPGSGSLMEKTNDWNSFRKNRPLLCLTFHLESCVRNVQLSSERDFFNGSSIINRFMGEMRRREGKGSVTTHFVCRPIFETIMSYLSNAEYMSTSSRKIDVSITSKRQKCWPRNSKESNLIKTGMTFSLN